MFTSNLIICTLGNPKEHAHSDLFLEGSLQTVQLGFHPEFLLFFLLLSKQLIL